MANKPRKYISAESLAVSTSALATDTTKVTATFTPDASSTYLYIWSCDVAGSGITLDSIVTLKNNAGSTLSTTNYESKDLTADWATLSGIAFETFGASPTSQSVTLTWRAETTSLTSSIRNARIVAIKLNSTDAFVENTADVTNATTTLAAATTLTFTPPSTGNYLILGSCETKTPALTASVISQITYNSIAYSAATNTPNDITNYMSGLLQASVGSLTATSKTVTLDFARVAGAGTVNCRRARLVALRLDEITDSSITVDNTLSSTTSISYVTETTTGAISTTSGMTYLVVGTASIAGDSTTISVGHGLSVDGVYASESFQESALAGTLASAHFGAIDVITAGTSTTVNFNYYTESASINSYTDEVTLSVLALDATDLYWVGGTGSWDATTATNWAITSGGTGGAAVPTGATNVNFDSASDSAAPFTVTVGTGALCRNLTASGLDNTMTLAGSAALSVYGNFTIPAANFTRTYTGTITFLSRVAGNTITTNGTTLASAITFNGSISSVWTLQDALTTTGAVTLTTGTLALSTYTLTIATFVSTGFTGRTLAFGTGKIVLTSAATTTIWNNDYNLGFDDFKVTGTTLVETTGGGATTKTITTSATETYVINFSLLNTAGTVAFTGSSSIRDLTIANNSFTLSNSFLTIYGNLTVGGTTVTLTAGTGIWTFGATSGTKTITTNGETLDFPITFNGAGGTFVLAGALTIGTSTARIVTHTNGIIDYNGYTVTLYGYWYLSQGVYAVTRQLINTGGISNKLILTIPAGPSTQVFNHNDLRSYSTDGNINVQITGTGLFYTGPSGYTLNNTLNWQVSSTSGTVIFGDATFRCAFKNLTIDNNSVTVNFPPVSNSIVILGNYTVGGTSPTISVTGNYLFAGTSGTSTINLNGHNSNTIDVPVTFDGVGGTFQLLHNLNVGTSTSRTVTLTNGTLDVADKILTIFGIFSSANANTRTITGTTGWIALSLNTATTILDTSTITNLSATNALFKITGSGATTKTINTGTLSEANAYSISVEHTAGTVNFTASNTVKNLTINSSETFGNPAITIYGNFTTTAVAYSSSNNVITFAGTGTQIITTNGITVDRALTFSGTGTFRLDSAMTMGNRNLTFSRGTLDLNNYNLTIGLSGSFIIGSLGTRILAHGTGNLVLPGSNNVTSSGTGMTSTGTGKISMTSASAKTFAGGTNSFNLISQDGSGILTIGGGSTFKSIRNTVQPATVQFTSGTTTTFTEGFELSGTAGNLITITSDGFTVYTLSKTSGTVRVSYVSIDYSTATGGATWIACTDQGAIEGAGLNNSGWLFTSCASSSNMLLMFF